MPTRLSLLVAPPIALGLLALGVVAIGDAGVAYLTVNAQADRVTALVQAASGPRLVERLRGEIYATTTESRGPYLAGDAAQAIGFATRLREQLTRIEADWRRLHAVLPVQEQAHTAILDQAMTDFVASRRDIARIGAEQGGQAADRFATSPATRAAADAFSQTLDELADATAMTLKQLETEAVSVARRTALTLLAATTLAVAILLALILWQIRRSVSLPLRYLADAFKDMADGRLDDVVLPPASDDEMGDMTAAAGLFLEQLIRTRTLEVAAAARLVARDQQEKALAVNYVRLSTAVTNMSQGLCMFDADNRLVISNPRFAEMFELPDDRLTIAMPLTKVVRGAIRSRSISVADVRRVRNDLVSLRSFPTRAAAVWDVVNGRTLSVALERTTEQGWLMTFADITERRRREAKIAHMARHDALTGLPNRILFHERLLAAAALAARGGAQAVLCIDLDHFKDVNDTLGHPVGDALLQAASGRILRCIREIDTVARLGGDEFAIILSSMRQPKDADALANRLIEEMGLPYQVAGHRVMVGISIGIAVMPDDGLDPNILLKSAELALYRAKADGRGRCRYFKPEMDDVLQARRLMELNLRNAFANHEFELYYQPLVHLQTQTVCGFEALLRWPRPGQPPIGPTEFIPVLEEIGLIIPLGEWIVETACRAAARWPNQVAVAVNLSPAQFASPNLVNMIRHALDQSGLQPDRLGLEITESLLLDDTDETLSTLHQLKALGTRISMDDFGTGYSSLSYLLKFPFDKVKIDRSFMTNLGEGGNCDAIVQAVTGMCRDLGIQTIAEGVETREQLDFLLQSNCNEVQGFLFSRPVPGSEVAALLANFPRKAAASFQSKLDARDILSASQT